jgi:leucyl-tRNA synthetase
MPEGKRPKGLFVHWWVTQKGKEKISKSKGGAEPIVEAALIYGVDAMRLYYVHVGSPFVDIEWDAEIVTKYKNRVANIWKLILKLSDLKGLENHNLDNWLKSIINRRIQKITAAFKEFNLREAANEIYFELQKDIQWYLKRGGQNSDLLKRFIDNWIILMTPVTPHLSEELWSLNHDAFCSNELYPDFNQKEIKEEVEIGEYLLSEVTNDINEILKVTKIKPNKIHIYISPTWKKDIFKKAIELEKQNKLNIGLIMKEIMADPKMKLIAKEISQYVSKIPVEIKRLSNHDRNRFLIPFKGVEYLENAKDYLKKVFSCEIEVYDCDAKDLFDPMNKSKFALPLRPALYIE